jgi:hydroxyethylthiazole kinase
MDITANVLLAAGASPAMVASTDECEHFATQCASAVLINLGTLSSDAVAAQRLTMHAARAAGKPVVLDPVACGATPYRTAACVAALRLRPTVVRGNAGEVVALAQAAGVWSEGTGAGAGGAGGSTPLVRGVDSAVGTADPRVAAAAHAIAHEFSCVVGVSGETDVVFDARGLAFSVKNGVEMLTRVTAAGCSLTALIAAFLAVADGGPHGTAFATAAALSVFGVAAELALRVAAPYEGPGSLRVGLLDQLYVMDEDEFKENAQIVNARGGAAGAAAAS